MQKASRFYLLDPTERFHYNRAGEIPVGKNFNRTSFTSQTALLPVLSRKKHILQICADSRAVCAYRLNCLTVPSETVAPV